jgi:hypothetical protein
MSADDCDWSTALAQAICDYEDDDSADFRVLGTPDLNDARPLLIWIHPGDAVEDRDAFEEAETEEDEDLYENTRQFQARMGEEIERHMATHQVVVLHRYSDQYAFEDGQAQWSYSRAMEAVGDEESTVHLFGDDLPAAAAWMVKHLGVEDRPVFMTGAYSDPDNGCLAAVGKALEAAGATIEVSGWSPSEPGSVANIWKPQPPEPESEPEPTLRRRRMR